MYSAEAQMESAAEPTIKSYCSNRKALSPKDGIFVDAVMDCGRKTLQGLKIPTKSDAKRPGKNLEVAIRVIVEIWVIPAVDKRNMYTTLIVLIHCAFCPFLTGEGLHAVTPRLDITNDVICCINSTQIGKNCHIAIKICFRLKVRTDGAGSTINIVGKTKPIVREKGMLASLGRAT